MTILVWLMVYLSNGMYPRMHISAYLRVGILIVACICFCVNNKKKLKLNILSSKIAITLLALQIITILVNGFYPELDLFLIAAILFALMFTSIITFDEFIKAYRRGIFWIAVISTVIFILAYFLPIVSKIPAMFLNSTNSSDTYTILGTFVVRQRYAYTYYRNYGIFSEPGQFQIFLSVGLILELFFRKKPSWKMLVAILAAYITSNSANGYITAALIVIAYLLNSRGDESKKARRLRYILASLTGIFLIVLLVTANSNVFITKVFEKIRGLSTEYSYTDLGTGLERRRAIDVSIRIFLQNPIMGLGFRGMQDYIHNLSSSGFIMTFTPMNWFARFGIIYGIIANAGYLGAFCRKPDKFISRTVLCLAILAMISAQAVGEDIFSCVLILYGCRHLMLKKGFIREQYISTN